MLDNAGGARFSFTIEGLREPLRVLRFEGREAVSELFQFEIALSSEDDALALADIVGRAAVLAIDSDVQPRLVHGVIARFEQAEEGAHFTTYHATLVPLAWLLQHRHDCRIFQELTVPQIITSVLEAAGLDAHYQRQVMHGEHPIREYCVQYRESDWAFISRLMEEEGILCFFEHHEDRHVLVMSDSLYVHEPLPGGVSLPFRPDLGALGAGEHVTRFRHTQEVAPGQVTLRDFNFKTPGLSLEVKAEAARDKALEIYDYPGEYATAGAGANIARIRLEGWRAATRTARGQSVCPRLTPGYLLALEEHPREPFNGKYMLLSVEHRGSQPAPGAAGDAGAPRYESSFRCVPADVPYRPPRRTPRPAVQGVQTAVVVGPAGEEIHTDSYGRVKVQFHWDRLGRKDDASSCWIRVSQVMAGQGWGAMFIPRVGQEVIVDFLEGDPDRPIITGRVYHETNPPPYPLPAERTKSTIKTNTSPGGGGSNELRFEDRKGREEIYLHGQKDWNILIENDKAQRIGNDESLEVVHNRAKVVGVDQSETIGANKRIEVGADHSELIGANQSIQIGENQTELVGGNEMKIVGGDRSLMVAQSEQEAVGINKTVEVGAHLSETVGAGMTVNVGGSKAETVGLASAETVGAAKALTIGGAYAITVGAAMATTVTGAQIETVGLSKVVTVGNQITFTCGASQVTMLKSGSIVVSGTDVSIKASGKVDLQAAGDVNVQAGSVRVKGSVIGMN